MEKDLANSPQCVNFAQSVPLTLLSVTKSTQTCSYLSRLSYASVHIQWGKKNMLFPDITHVHSFYYLISSVRGSLCILDSTKSAWALRRRLVTMGTPQQGFHHAVFPKVWGGGAQLTCLVAPPQTSGSSRRRSL